jgi:hypothetical protein
MRNPDVYKALDPPEICLKRASRPYRHTMKTTLSVVAALDPRGATLLSTPAAFVAHIRFLGVCPKGGLKVNHLEAGIPPGFCSFERPALAAA